MSLRSKRLYPHDKKKAPKAPLRIAEEFRTYFGQAGLDDFLRTRLPDKSWSPGPLHGALLASGCGRSRAALR
jgi:hypothetical protein